MQSGSHIFYVVCLWGSYFFNQLSLFCEYLPKFSHLLCLLNYICFVISYFPGKLFIIPGSH